MNPENHGSREACQKLFKEGIVVETDAVWIYARHIPLKGADKFWKLFDRRSLMAIEATQQRPDCIIPALSMAEVWRELPETRLFALYVYEKVITGEGDTGKTKVGYFNRLYGFFLDSVFIQDNPADALIELLIWVRKEGGVG